MSPRKLLQAIHNPNLEKSTKKRIINELENVDKKTEMVTLKMVETMVDKKLKKKKIKECQSSGLIHKAIESHIHLQQAISMLLNQVDQKKEKRKTLQKKVDGIQSRLDRNNIEIASLKRSLDVSNPSNNSEFASLKRSLNVSNPAKPLKTQSVACQECQNPFLCTCDKVE